MNVHATTLRRMNHSSKFVSQSRLVGPYGPILTAGILFLLLWTLSRAVLLAVHAGAVSSASELWQLMAWGLRMDLQAMAILLAPMLVATLLLHHRRTVTVWRALFASYFTLMAAIALLLELATPDFIAEYGVRPNRLFFEYLSHPHEVLDMLLASRPLKLLGGLGAVLAAGALLAWQFWGAAGRTSLRSSTTLLWFLPLLMLCFAFARGTTGHRALNPANAAVTASQTLNDIALNSSYSVAYAVYAMKNEEGMDLHYGDMSPEQALRTVRAAMTHVPASAYVDTTTTMHQQVPAASPRYTNFVLILEESLGAEFVGRLGGLPLTPHLDALGDSGWWFDQLYATGTRSVRGIEAVTTGFLPSPARAVVKLPGAQNGFYTIARTLAEAGWSTQFIYGGDANFDNMRRFLSNNGFQSVVENRDFADDLYRTTWGVADEFVLQRAHQSLADGNLDQPQFIFAFSSTNHEPFDFPPDRIENYAQPTMRVENAVKYADWSIGQFFEAARASDYWDRTLFLVVADHNSRVYGDGLIPIDRFHIPGVFIGQGIAPRVHTQVASQLDLPVTALSLLGVQSVHPMVGRDLTQPYAHGRAIMQFRDNQAYMQDDQLVVLRPRLAPSGWAWDGQQLHASPAEPELVAAALGHAVWAKHAYASRLYGPVVGSVSVAMPNSESNLAD